MFVVAGNLAILEFALLEDFSDLLNLLNFLDLLHHRCLDVDFLTLCFGFSLRSLVLAKKDLDIGDWNFGDVHFDSYFS